MEIGALIHKPSEEMPPTQFVGGIFPRKHISIIAAKSGVGKTWFVLKLLTDLSNGGNIFNGALSYYEPKRKCILFVGETGLELVNERQRLMYDKADDSNFGIISRIEAGRHGFIIDLSNRDGIRPIFNICKDYQPDIIVFDTLMSFRSDDENAMQNTNTMLSNLQALAEQYNVAIVATHHVRKRQNGAKERIDQDELIGSSALVRQTAVAFILSKRGYNYSLTPVKTWWKIEKPVEYRMIEQFGQVVFDEAKFEDGGNMTQRRLRAEEYLQHLEDDETVTVKEIADKFGFDKVTAQKIIVKHCQLVKESQGSAPAVYMKFALNSAQN